MASIALTNSGSPAVLPPRRRIRRLRTGPMAHAACCAVASALSLPYFLGGGGGAVVGLSLSPLPTTTTCARPLPNARPVVASSRITTLPLAGSGGTRRQPTTASASRSLGILPMAPFDIRFNRDDKNKEEHSKRREKWLSWMHSGKPKKRDWDVEDIKQREAVELGGLPRSDRYSSRDWFHNTITLPYSTILRDVLNPVLSVSIWSTIISVVHRIVLRRRPSLAEHMCIPTAPHSMMVSALGLLLVFRTNSAYQRFAEGRQIWERILNTSRDLSRMSKLYEVEIGKEKRRRVQRLLATFPYLLRYRIRPSTVMKRVGDPEHQRDPQHSLLLYQDQTALENDAEAARIASVEETTGKSRRKPRELYWVDRRTLPWRLLPSDAMEACARAQNRPLWICDRMAMELRTVPDQGSQFTNRERLHLVGLCDQLSRAIGSCERIHQTVVPLNYARHLLRTLTVWLLSLPFALVKDLGLMCGPVLFVISWMLFGVYEIGTRIEDPFQGTLRLSILCDQIRRDVLSDELLRDTAFTLDRPKTKDKKGVAQLAADGDEDDDDDDDDDEVAIQNGAAGVNVYQ